VSRVDRAVRRAARWRRHFSGGVIGVGFADPRVQDAALDAIDLGVLRFRRGELNEVTFLHDDWCPHLRIRGGKRGRCRCRPDVVVPARGDA
jgi:hypothetical protein